MSNRKTIRKGLHHLQAAQLTDFEIQKFSDKSPFIFPLIAGGSAGHGIHLGIYSDY